MSSPLKLVIKKKIRPKLEIKINNKIELILEDCIHEERTISYLYLQKNYPISLPSC